MPGSRLPAMARRWLVERMYSRLNRFRWLLIRWEMQVESYLALLHFGCAWVTLSCYPDCPIASKWYTAPE